MIAHVVFDIGKTNKKYFLFDEEGEILKETSTVFETIEDEEGFPSDDLDEIEKWMRSEMNQLLSSKDWEIRSINFSGYGASIVYLDENGKRLPLFVNYLKPFPIHLEEAFFEKYGPKEQFCRETASPFLGMLNSGLQIYWLKYEKPEMFRRLKHILHFPQYLNYVFTGVPVSEYTSIGCHTGMWHFEKQDYHPWVYEEGIVDLLPPIRSSDDWMECEISGKSLKAGMGFHDTSASLIPYLKKEKEPFLLLSTGTWTISVNPFSTDSLSADDLENDCLNFLRMDGGQVRVARLFLGREHEIQVEKISDYFNVEKSEILNLEWNEKSYEAARKKEKFPFRFEHLSFPSSLSKTGSGKPSWIDAYYQLMDLLIPLQVDAIHRSMGNGKISKVIIEGGFTKNVIFVKLLRKYLPDHEVEVSQIKGGSARGVFEVKSEYW